MPPAQRKVAITGATGYMGRALTTKLIARGHHVRALIRPGSRHRVVAGAEPVTLDLFNVSELARALWDRDTVVHLVGTAHPNPSKAEEFRRVDLPAARACIAAAARNGLPHFIYVSVAHPAPVMQAYVATRVEAERELARTGLTATVLRPWYVLGPGHRWPLVLEPLYAIAELIPGLAEPARRLGLVSLEQMIDALVEATEHPPRDGAGRIVDVPQIRRTRLG
jgi:nucleoside-diphosphate-sugar epimerase